MNKKIRNLQQLEYLSTFETASTIVLNWSNQKPDNKELKVLQKAMIDLAFYVRKIEDENRLCELSFSEYRSDKIRAVERARKAETKCEDLQKEIDKYKKLLNI